MYFPASAIKSLLKNTSYILPKNTFLTFWENGALLLWELCSSKHKKFQEETFRPQCSNFYLKLDSRLSKEIMICFIENPLKVMKKNFLFHLKSSIRSQDI